MHLLATPLRIIRLGFLAIAVLFAVLAWLIVVPLADLVFDGFRSLWALAGRGGRPDSRLSYVTLDVSDPTLRDVAEGPTPSGAGGSVRRAS